jgi:hypothetical protein
MHYRGCLGIDGARHLHEQLAQCFFNVFNKFDLHFSVYRVLLYDHVALLSKYLLENRSGAEYWLIS